MQMTKLFSKAKVSSLHGECWLLVFCFTYLPITKRLLLTKHLISYFPDFHLVCIPLFQFTPLPPAVATLSSTKWSHLSTLPHFYPFILTNSDEILIVALFFTDSVRTNISYIALSSCNPLAHLHRTIVKPSQSSCS